MGMPAGMWELLQRKYDILKQQADADSSRAVSAGVVANSNANLDYVRAGLLPKQVQSDIERQAAEAARIKEETKYVGPLARSSMELSSANAFANRAQGGLYRSQTGQLDQMTKMMPRIGGFGWSPEEEAALNRFYNPSRFGLGN